jgi:hypothetical protein
MDSGRAPRLNRPTCSHPMRVHWWGLPTRGCLRVRPTTPERRDKVTKSPVSDSRARDLPAGKLTPKLSDRIVEVRDRQYPTLSRHSLC